MTHGIHIIRRLATSPAVDTDLFGCPTEEYVQHGAAQRRTATYSTSGKSRTRLLAHDNLLSTPPSTTAQLDSPPQRSSRSEQAGSDPPPSDYAMADSSGPPPARHAASRTPQATPRPILLKPRPRHRPPYRTSPATPRCHTGQPPGEAEPKLDHERGQQTAAHRLSNSPPTSTQRRRRPRRRPLPQQRRPLTGRKAPLPQRPHEVTQVTTDNPAHGAYVGP
jgi:hypothetical protein